MGVLSQHGKSFCEECGKEVAFKKFGYEHLADGTSLCPPAKPIRFDLPPEGHRRITDLWDDTTLRDRFAMAALTGIMSNQYPVDMSRTKLHARAAFELADAMMEERKRETKTEGGDGPGLAGSGVGVPLGAAAEQNPGEKQNVAEDAWPVNRRGSPEHD